MGIMATRHQLSNSFQYQTEKKTNNLTLTPKRFIVEKYEENSKYTQMQMHYPAKPVHSLCHH